jgi:transcriptional regulator with XRE-family HTH domain
MLTEFGKALRKIRIDRNELLGDMAEKLGYSSSYLSSAENGRRGVPQDVYEKVLATYDLNDIERRSLYEGIASTKKKIFIDIAEADQDKTETALAFAYAFKAQDESSMGKILEISKILQQR